MCCPPNPVYSRGSSCQRICFSPLPRLSGWILWMSCGKMPNSSQFCVRAAAAELWGWGGPYHGWSWGAELSPQAVLGHLGQAGPGVALRQLLPLKVTFQQPLPPPVHICLPHLRLWLGIALGWLYFSHLLMVFFVFFTVLE